MFAKILSAKILYFTCIKFVSYGTYTIHNIPCSTNNAILEHHNMATFIYKAHHTLTYSIHLHHTKKLIYKYKSKITKNYKNSSEVE